MMHNKNEGAKDFSHWSATSQVEKHIIFESFMSWQLYNTTLLRVKHFDYFLRVKMWYIFPQILQGMAKAYYSTSLRTINFRELQSRCKSIVLWLSSWMNEANPREKHKKAKRKKIIWPIPKRPQQKATLSIHNTVHFIVYIQFLYLWHLKIITKLIKLWTNYL